jgi:tetratricopeptide (TPR) repeat protein
VIETLLKKALELDPQLAEAHLQLGNLYFGQKNYVESIPEFERVLHLSPQTADAHYKLGQAYFRTGDKNRADEQLAIYQRVREKNLAELEKQRAEIKQFVYSAKDSPGGKP